MVLYNKNTIITYENALNILGRIDNSYPQNFQVCCSKERFSQCPRTAYKFVDECIMWSIYPQYKWDTINEQVHKLFDSN